MNANMDLVKIGTVVFKKGGVCRLKTNNVLGDIAIFFNMRL